MVPFVPPGVCIGSISHIMRLLSVGRYSEQVRRDTSVRMALGQHATHMTASVSDCFSVDAILNDHSVVPLIGALLDHETESDLFTRIRSGAPYENLRKQVGRGTLVARCIRRCPICVVEDEAKYGVAFWRVAHQLLPIHYCSKHHVILEEMCGNCGMPYAVRSTAARTSLARCSRCGSSTGMAPPDWSKKRPTAYEPFESLVERALRGETQELRPPNRLAIITAAVKSSDGSIAQLIDLFCRWWDVDRLEELRSWFGTSVTQDILNEILLGRRWVDPTFAVIAVMSFAQEWLRQRNTDVQEPLRFSAVTHDGGSGLDIGVESQLLERAAEAGIPEWQALQIAAGNAFRVSGMRGAEGIAIRRFLDSLPQELHEAVAERHALARAKRKSSLPGEFDADRWTLVKHRRAAVLDLLSSGSMTRNKLWRNHGSLMTWLTRHDRSWLQAQLPDRLFRPHIWKSIETAREEFLSTIEALLAHCPSAGLMDLIHQNVQLHAFLERHDPAWLEAKKETFKQTTDPKKRFDNVSQRRTEFLAAVHDPSLASTALSLRAPAAHAWLRLNDGAWLREQTRHMKEQKQDQKTLEKRDAVVRYMEQGIRRRGDFAKAHWGLYYWMLKNDRKWFDTHLPSPQAFVPRSRSEHR